MKRTFLFVVLVIGLLFWSSFKVHFTKNNGITFHAEIQNWCAKEGNATFPVWHGNWFRTRNSGQVVEKGKTKLAPGQHSAHWSVGNLLSYYLMVLPSLQMIQNTFEAMSLSDTRKNRMLMDILWHQKLSTLWQWDEVIPSKLWIILRLYRCF